MAIQIIKDKISYMELQKIAAAGFGDFVKAVVDVRQGIMAIGGELHADEEVLLTEHEGSKREDVWGINLYPGEQGERFIEFNSMINLKPALGNRSRGVSDPVIQEKIKTIVAERVLT